MRHSCILMIHHNHRIFSFIYAFIHQLNFIKYNRFNTHVDTSLTRVKMPKKKKLIKINKIRKVIEMHLLLFTFAVNIFVLRFSGLCTIISYSDETVISVDMNGAAERNIKVLLHANKFVLYVYTVLIKYKVL